MKLKLKLLVFLAFFVIGVFPLAASVYFNLPKVVAVLEVAAQDRLLSDLDRRFSVLQQEVERNREGLRLFAMLPGPLDLVGLESRGKAEGGLSRQQLRERIGRLVNRAFGGRPEMLDIAVIDGNGQEQLHMVRAHAGGFVAEPEANLRQRGSESVFLQGLAARPGEVFMSGVEVMGSSVAAGSSPPQVLVRLATPVRSQESGVNGLVVFTVDLRGVFPDLERFDLVDQDGVCLIAGTHADGQGCSTPGHIFADFPRFAEQLGSGRALILRHESGKSYGWLPLFSEGAMGERRIWVGQPVDNSLREAWLRRFIRNLAMIGVVLVVLLAGVSLLLARYVDLFRQRFMEGVAAILKEERPPELGWRWPEELARLNSDLDRLAETQRAHATARRAAEARLAHELAVKEAMVDLSAQLLGTSCAVGAVADGVVEAAKRLTGSAHGFVGTIDPVSRALVIHTFSRMMGESCGLQGKDKRIEFPLGEDGRYPALWGFVLNEKKSFFANKPVDHPASTGCPEGHIPIIRFLAVPVLLADELVGQIAVANSDRDYTGQDLAALERLANHFAQAIRGIRLSMERDRLQIDLQQAQKMEAIGTLAGGVAHDFNNMLTPILGYTDLAMARLSVDDKLRHDLGEIRKAAQRAKSLVQQILAFSRQKPQELIPLDVTPLLKETMKLLRATLPTTIEFRLDIRSDCGQVMADPTQVQQVLINLCTNAAHAMDDLGGVLGIGLDEITITGAGDQADLQAMSAGRYLRLVVSDTGCGMERAVLARIFEPYFTTKEQGKGTGMGLALVHGIVKSHAGHITVDSTPGKGSVFRVYLPVIAPVAATGAGGVMAVSLPRGTERVLLVDDEETVAAMHQEMLAFLGYQVTTATDGRVAYELFRANPDAFDLVITDQTMPGMTGEALAAQLLAIRPELPLVICTGFSQAFSEEKAREAGIQGYVMKPVVIGELAATLRRVLGGGGNG